MDTSISQKIKRRDIAVREPWNLKTSSEIWARINEIQRIINDLSKLEYRAKEKDLLTWKGQLTALKWVLR